MLLSFFDASMRPSKIKLLVYVIILAALLLIIVVVVVYNKKMREMETARPGKTLFIKAL